jgi:hypothetical protein
MISWKYADGGDSPKVVVFVVRMDGSYKGAFVLIQKECPSVQCFVCPAHGMDGFLKNVGSSAGMLPWDIGMTVEEPLSDDEDGVPHGVSDSESESDKDSD